MDFSGFMGTSMFRLFCCYFTHPTVYSKINTLEGIHSVAEGLKIPFMRNPIRGFFTMALVALSTLDNKISNKWFKVLVALKFRGLSLSGIALLGKLGIGRGKSHFKRRFQTMNNKVASKVLTERPSAVWIDNFGKVMAFQVPKGSHAFHQSAWTAVCKKEHPSRKLPLLTAPVDTPNAVASVIPDHKEQYMHKKTWLTREIKTQYRYFDEALVVKLEVAHIPLKPETKTICSKLDNKTSDKYIKALNDIPDGPRHMTPLEMSHFNVSSNTGLMGVLHSLQKYKSEGKIIVVAADCDIYFRHLKVVFLKLVNVSTSRIFNHAFTFR